MVLFPAMIRPLRSISTERPAPRSRRLASSALRPRSGPLLALRRSAVRLEIFRRETTAALAGLLAAGLAVAVGIKWVGKLKFNFADFRRRAASGPRRSGVAI